MIIDCVSDLHGHYPKMEGGDLLVIAGDCTSDDKVKSWRLFFKWLEAQPYLKKVIVAGNHDNCCTNWATAGSFSEDDFEEMYPGEKSSMDYLCDSGTEFEGLKIWGSPWTKTFSGINPHCTAFTVDTEEELSKKWELIPADVDILITHSPSFGNLDILSNGKSAGCMSLWLTTLSIKPKLHVFGHVHESYGTVDHPCGIKIVNASHVNENYESINPPIRIVL